MRRGFDKQEAGAENRLDANETQMAGGGVGWGENSRLSFQGAGTNPKLDLLGDGQEQTGAGRGRHVGDSLGIR